MITHECCPENRGSVTQKVDMDVEGPFALADEDGNERSLVEAMSRQYILCKDSIVITHLGLAGATL